MEKSDSPSSPWGSPSTQASRDWARHGHAAPDALASVIRIRPDRSRRGSAAAPRLSRQARRAAGTLLLAVVALGSAGSALALRDALFPTVGDATTRSVWQNPGQTAQELAASTTSTSTATTTSTTTTVGTTSAAPETVVEFEPQSTTPSNGTAPGPATTRPRTTTPSTGTVDDGNQPAVTTASSGTSPPTTDDDDDEEDDDDDSSGSDNSGSGSDNSGSGSSGSGSDDD